MSDYDLRCINCYHRSHEGKPCPYCPAPTPDNPNARCIEFVRADLFAARALARMEQNSMQAHGQLMMALSTMFDLFTEAYPEAADRMKAKLEERQKAAEAAMEMQRTQALAEADAALMAAREAEERQALDTLVEGYVAQDNVLQFPQKAQALDFSNSDDPNSPKGVA